MKNKVNTKLKGGSCLTGLRQVTGTCYFNSVYNVLLLGDVGKRLFYGSYIKFYELHPQFPVLLQKVLDSIDKGYCLNIDKRGQFYAYMIIALCKQKSKQTVNASNSRMIQNLMNTINVKDSGRGGYPQMMLENLLDMMYVIHKGSTVDYDKAPISVLQHTQSLLIAKNYFPKVLVLYTPVLKLTELFNANIPKNIMITTNGKEEPYILDHAILMFTLNGIDSHVVACTFCNGTPIIYDSNKDKSVNIDWTINNEIQANKYNLMEYVIEDQGTKEREVVITNWTFNYICYIRQKYIDTLPAAPDICALLDSISKQDNKQQPNST
jgi:hypothetical protein